MKPCHRNKKTIAWLAADALDAGTAKKLREHLNECPGCSEYFRELSMICRSHSAAGQIEAEGQAGPSFHALLLRRVKDYEAQPVCASMTELMGRWFTVQRVAISTAALVFALLFALPDPRTGHDLPRRGSSAPRLTFLSAVKTDLQPTFSNYRMAANKSLEALDDLLARQGSRQSTSGGVL